jgi:alpha-2-macroglobulin
MKLRQLRSRHATTSFSIGVAIAIIVSGCTDQSAGPASTRPSSTATSVAAPRVTTGGGAAGLPVLAKGPSPRLFQVNLSEGDIPNVVATAAVVTAGDEVDEDRRTELIDKLPAWEDPATLAQPFVWPTQSSPPPRAGTTIDQPFPPKSDATSGAPAVDNGPLKVVRVQPEGDVPIAPYLAVTFNQPVVPIGTVSQLTPETAPVKLDPPISGRWQWIGTRTLRFDADSETVDRLPMATTFTATVPAGTKSVAGGTLTEAATFTFATPAPTVLSFGPQQENLSLEPVFVAVFDQRIDQVAVLASITLNASGNVALRLATKEEVAANDFARSIAENAEDGRWIAFRPVRALPTDTDLVVNIGPKTPSAEGPRSTDKPQTFTGRTYGPLKVRASSCDYGDACPPGSSIFIEFSNPLDPKAVGTSGAAVMVSPALAAQKITVNQVIAIEGATQARTKYTMSLPASLTDIYGQTLGKDETVTIQMGTARKSLRPLGLITTLDPFTKAQKLSVLSTNQKELRVRVFSADPAKFNEYLTYVQEREQNSSPPKGWKVLTDRKVKPEGTDDSTVETLIDLGPQLEGKPGQVIVLVEPSPPIARESDEYWENQPTLSWVQSTTMALDSFAMGKELRVWATDLRTGAPVPGLAISALQPEASATTNAVGLALLPLEPGETVRFVTGTRGRESFILQAEATANIAFDSARWFTFDDRQIYRPGEAVSLKGWVREISGSTGGLSTIGNRKATYITTDGNGVEIAKGNMTLGPLGGFDLKLAIATTANLGPANIQLTLDGASSPTGNHQFQIAEFRRPEFEVAVEPVTAASFVSTNPVTMTTQASYFAGGPLPAAPVNWIVSATETTYSPIGWDGFTFGIFRPWWWAESYGATGDFGFGESPAFGRGGGFPGNPGVVKQYTGTTDASGRHALQLDFIGENGVLPDLPVSVNVGGTVTDVNRQAWADQRDILVHSADRYVGLRSDRSFVRQGDKLNIDAIATDIDGKSIAGTKLTLRAGLLRTSYVDGKTIDEIVDPQTCEITTKADASKCEFNTPVGGQYQITTTVTDAKGGRNRTELSVWVSGAASQPARTVEQEALTIIPDKAQYAAGVKAKLLVQAPFLNGTGLMVVTHGNGVRETRQFSAADGSAEVEIAITEADVPNLNVVIEVVGAADRVGLDGKKIEGTVQRPAYAVGTLTLSVPPLSRTLAVTATPADVELAPGGKTSIAVTVKDAKGAPVKDTEFAVVVVDEAVLGLSNYTLPDPVAIFYGNGYESLSTQFGRAQVRLADPETLSSNPAGGQTTRGQSDSEGAPETAAASVEQFSEAPAAAADSAAPLGRALKSAAPKQRDGGIANPISVRSNFDALALFQPTVVTDAAGLASVEVTLPDNLTRYRVMVVAVNGNERFGTAESNITARLPLSIRPSAPRFLNSGDSFELPVIVQNLGKEAMAVDVVVQLANLDSTGPSARRVTVPAGDRVEVRFPAKVRSAGTARIRVSGFGPNVTDSAELAIPVYTPGTTEAFATYGTIDNGAIRQPVKAPTDVFDGYGGLEISTSSTSLQALTDALLYVSTYDYQSSDAYASRIMAIGALRDVLKDFGAADLPSEAELNQTVTSDIAGLVGLQNGDGGWSYWRRDERSQPMTSVQATHALLLAKQAGYAVSPNTLERAQQYVANVEQYVSPEYGESYRDTVRAYGLWVQALGGQRDPAKASALFAERGAKLNLDALAWVWGSIDDPAAKATIERTITNRAVDTAGAVSFTSGYTDSDYLTLGSDRRTDAIVLDSLIANTPKSDLIEKVVAGLTANKTKGRWDNIQENTFALLAFKRYYDTYESTTPDFIAKAWLGTQFVGEQSFKGRTTDQSDLTIPMKPLAEGGDRDLVIQKDGAGRLYYRIGLRYVPADLTLDALDRGFVINRIYEGVDNKADVQRLADGTWQIKAGAKVRIRLTMVAESQRTHVALIDPLPAGLEALNPALANTQPVADTSDQGTQGLSKLWWWGTWYDHQQFRDDRSEAFTTFLPAGVYDYSYIARATTPGSFVVPPTRAEEMYAPETFGRASTDRVVIK